MDRDEPGTDSVWMMRILAEFREMPGLCLTVEQASRLWGLDRTRCLACLERLALAGALRRTPQGAYVTTNGGHRP